MGKVIHKVLAPGPFSGATDADTIERSRKILNGYFERVRSANPDRWEAGKAAFIAVNPGIRAHLMLIGEIITYLQHKKGLDFISLNEEKCVEYVSEIAQPVFDFFRNASDEEIAGKFSRKFGEGGVKEYLYNLCEIIFGRFDDFGSEEFRTYITQKDSDEVVKSNQFIITLTEMMMDYVIDVLKAVYGTNILDSGESAYWENGIASQRIKDNAYRKQQDDKKRRTRKEAYLEILDLKDIVQQPDNWMYFESVFNNPMPGEKKGKKYYTSWMADLNDLRRTPFHKSSLRNYTDEDFEFLN